MSLRKVIFESSFYVLSEVEQKVAICYMHHPTLGSEAVIVDGPPVMGTHHCGWPTHPPDLEPPKVPLGVTNPVFLGGCVMTCTHVIALSHTHLTTLNMLCAPPVQLAQTLETTDVFTARWTHTVYALFQVCIGIHVVFVSLYSLVNLFLFSAEWLLHCLEIITV